MCILLRNALHTIPISAHKIYLIKALSKEPQISFEKIFGGCPYWLELIMEMPK